MSRAARYNLIARKMSKGNFGGESRVAQPAGCLGPVGPSTSPSSCTVYSVEIEDYAGILSGNLQFLPETQIGATDDIYVDEDGPPVIVHVPAGMTFVTVEAVLDWEPISTDDVVLELQLFTDPDFDDLSRQDTTTPAPVGSTTVTVNGTDAVLFGVPIGGHTMATDGWLALGVHGAVHGDPGTTVVTSISGLLTFCWTA